MSMPTKLSEKHWKVLRMLENDVSRKEVATSIGWTYDHVKKLCAGNTEKAGGVAILFKAEYEKICVKSKAETDKLVQSNLKIAQRLMREVFEDISKKKKKTDNDKKILSLYTNAIAKCQPSVNIKNLSYSYTKGLSAEELVHEFKRLKTVAEASFDRGAISKAAKGRTRNVPKVDE